jgi:hypothetical protein
MQNGFDRLTTGSKVKGQNCGIYSVIPAKAGIYIIKLL